MKLGWGLFRHKYVLLVLILIAALVVLIEIHEHNKLLKPKAIETSSKQLASEQYNLAAGLLTQKNYAQAAQSYIAAAGEMSLSSQTQKGIAILQDGINKIPDQYITWSYYDELAALAKASGNNSLYISSLKKALAKAEQPGSGATQDTINSYNDALKKLGAD